jgi:hypothetical protein
MWAGTSVSSAAEAGSRQEQKVFGRPVLRRPFYSRPAAAGNISFGTEGAVKRRQVEIELEDNRLLVLRRPYQTAPVLCGRCGCGMLLLEEAVAVGEVSSRVIYRLVEAGALHFSETQDGLLLVCLKSLLSAVSEKGFPTVE